MDNLDEAREAINHVDAQMAALFAERMATVAHVAAYKAEHNLPIVDEQREQQVLERNAELVNEEIRPYYLHVLEATMEASRRYQQHLIESADNA